MILILPDEEIAEDFPGAAELTQTASVLGIGDREIEQFQHPLDG